MVRVSKRFLERAKANLRRYQKLLDSARSRDVNESDTVLIATDFLAEVLGYDKYSELTTEFSVRSTFCDLAIKLDNEIHYLIEVKSAGTELRENHLRQAVDYAANQGIESVILTNGVVWQVHRVKFEQPIQHELVLAIDLLDPNVRTGQLIQDLYLLSREAIGAGEMDRYWRLQEAANRHVIGQLLLSEPIVNALRREIRRLCRDLKVGAERVEELLRNEIIKREVLEGERADAAAKLVRRIARRRQRAKAAGEPPASAPGAVAAEQALPPQPVNATLVPTRN
jgi:hypothetical protein